MSVTTPTKNSAAQAVTKSRGRKSGVATSHRPSTNFSDEIMFTYKRLCIKYGCRNIPDIVFYTEEQQIRTPDDSKICFIIKKTSQDEWVDKVIYRNYPVEIAAIESLAECLFDMRNLVLLKIENCNLRSEHLEVLSDTLKMNPNITDVSINGNPNEEQNHYFLLKSTNLQTLSLKFCNINSEGIAKIVTELYRTNLITLLHLNLASNSLYDEGVEQVAKLLRLNRTLVSLNLADNKITSKGCEMLMNTLKIFPLTHDETVIRRQITFEYQKNVQPTKSKRISKSSPGPVGKHTIKDKALICSTKPARPKSITKILANADIEYHPFVHDSFEEDGDIYCKGNDVLINLNLSYNRISKNGLDSILEALIYQKQNYRNDKGISRISVEGNEFNNTCVEEISDMEALLKLKNQISSNLLVNSCSSVKKKKSAENLKKQ